MDEPFAAVDPITRAALQSEMLRIQRATKKTIVFVTHDIDEALRLASDIAVMDRGRIAQWGPPLEIVEHPASDFVAEFVGGETRGLKLLALRTVADRLTPGAAAEGEPLSSDASLRDALAAMTAQRTDRLPVVDTSGRPVGAITLTDLVR
jgi:osmoprotectant transport system ATP-binding protein